MSRRWHDLWMSALMELVAGCALIVISGSWWFHSYGAVWSSGHNLLLFVNYRAWAVGVARAWRRRGEEPDESAKLAADVMGCFRVSCSTSSISGCGGSSFDEGSRLAASHSGLGAAAELLGFNSATRST